MLQNHLYIKLKKGRSVEYAYSDEEKAKLVGSDADQVIELEEELAAEEAMNEEGAEETEEMTKKKSSKISIQRYKGLGEMNPVG